MPVFAPLQISALDHHVHPGTGLVLPTEGSRSKRANAGTELIDLLLVTPRYSATENPPGYFAMELAQGQWRLAGCSSHQHNYRF